MCFLSFLLDHKHASFTLYKIVTQILTIQLCITLSMDHNQKSMICLVCKSEIECGCHRAKNRRGRDFYFLSPNQEKSRSMPGRSLKEKGLIACKDCKRRFSARRNWLNELGQNVRCNVSLKQRNLHAKPCFLH